MVGSARHAERDLDILCSVNVFDAVAAKFRDEITALKIYKQRC